MEAVGLLSDNKIACQLHFHHFAAAAPAPAGTIRSLTPWRLLACCPTPRCTTSHTHR
jgi:hypothetical protein